MGRGNGCIATLDDWERANAPDDPIEGKSDKTHVAFVDLGWRHDPGVLAVGRREKGKVRTVWLQTLQGDQDRPVSLASRAGGHRTDEK